MQYRIKNSIDILKNLETTTNNTVESSTSRQVKKHPGGRPKKNSDQSTATMSNNANPLEKKQLQAVLKYHKEHKDDCTIAGFSRILGYRSGLDFIADAKKNKSNKALRLAISFVEERYEHDLLSKYTTGAIFALKQLGWADTQRVEAEINGLDINIALSQSVEEISQKLSEGCEIRN